MSKSGPVSPLSVSPIGKGSTFLGLIVEDFQEGVVFLLPSGRVEETTSPRDGRPFLEDKLKGEGLLTALPFSDVVR